MKPLLFLLFASLIAAHQNARANVVSDSINTLLSKRNFSVNSAVSQNLVSEKYHDFDQFNQNFAFVLFYRSTCPHCERFAPILAQFASDFGFRVYAYATDGQAIQSFPKAMPMTAQVQRTFFNTPNIEVPSLFIVNTRTLQTYLIDQGEMSANDLQNTTQSFFQMIKNRGATT